MSSSLHNIGMVTVDYLPAFGGMGRHTSLLTEGLRACGHSVKVFDASQRPLNTRFGRSVGFSLALRSALLRFVTDESIDLLHVHTGPGGALLSSPVGSVPLIVTAHHTYAQQATLAGEGWKKVLIPWEKRTLRSANAVVAVSPDTADVLVNAYGIPAANITVIPPGIPVALWRDADAETADRDRWSVVFVGRRDTRKGFDRLREAWRTVHQALPEAHLSVVGFSGKDQNGISYYGRLSDDDLRTLVGRSRAVVCPSSFEGFGLVAAEACAAGTPVVAANVAGLRFVLQGGDTGILVDAHKSDRLAEGIVSLLTDDALWDQLHTGARSVREQFSDAMSVDRHIDLYHRVYLSR